MGEVHSSAAKWQKWGPSSSGASCWPAARHLQCRLWLTGTPLLPHHTVDWPYSCRAQQSSRALTFAQCTCQLPVVADLALPGQVTPCRQQEQSSCHGTGDAQHCTAHSRVSCWSTAVEAGRHTAMSPCVRSEGSASAVQHTTRLQGSPGIAQILTAAAAHIQFGRTEQAQPLQLGSCS